MQKMEFNVSSTLFKRFYPINIPSMARLHINILSIQFMFLRSLQVFFFSFFFIIYFKTNGLGVTVFNLSTICDVNIKLFINHNI